MKQNIYKVWWKLTGKKSTYSPKIFMPKPWLECKVEDALWKSQQESINKVILGEVKESN